MSLKKKIKTLKVLIEGSILISDQNKYSLIIDEINNILTVKGISEPRKIALIKILHMTRTLDSALKLLLTRQGRISAGSRTLGSYLKDFVNQRRGGIGNLSERSRKYYQREIIDKRNRYMHDAGIYPRGNLEVNELLDKVDECLNEVLSL